MIETTKEHLTVLQIGRAVAALAVVFHHASLSARDFVSPLPYPAQSIMMYGWVGVDFFFVLSGFIIFHSTLTATRDVAGLRRYAVQRAIRVFTPYLPIAIAVMTLYAIGIGGGEYRWNVVSTLTLLPTAQPPALSVAWTLQHELIFYAVFALGFFSGRLVVVMTAWSAAIIAAVVTGTGNDLPASILINPINLEFVFGILAAAAYTKGSGKRSMLAPVGAGCTLLIWILAFDADRDHSFILGAAIALAILPAVYWKSNQKSKMQRIGLFMGAASYSLYLVHNPLLSVITRFVLRLGRNVSPWAVFGAGVATSIVVAGLYHLFFEIPATAYLRARFCKTLTRASPMSNTSKIPY